MHLAKPSPWKQMTASSFRSCAATSTKMTITGSLRSLLIRPSFLIRQMILLLIIHGPTTTNWWTPLILSVEGKGGATRGAAGGHGEICLECLGNYTAEEMQEALIFLAIILAIFIAVCSCQMYHRAKWELEGNKGKRPMPMAPYDRDVFVV